MARSFWLTIVCVVCLVVFVVRLEASPAGGDDTKKNATTNSTKGGSTAGDSDEACDLDPEPEAEAEPTGHKNNSTASKSGSDRQGKALEPKDADKYNTTSHHDGVPEPEPESEPTKNGTTNASTNNQATKSDNPTAGKSTGNNTTTTTPSTPSAGGSKSVLSFTALALLAVPVFL